MKNVHVKKMTSAIALLLTGIGGAHATLVVTPNGPYKQLDDAYTAEIVSLSSTGAIGQGWTSAGNLLRSTGSDGLYIHSLTADTTAHGATTIRSATFQAIGGAGLNGYGLTTGSDGYLYGNGFGALYKIDQTSWTSTVVANSGWAFGIAANKSGDIFYSNDTVIGRYNITTGISSVFHDGATFYDDLSIDPFGYIFAAALGSCALDIIDPSGGLVQRVSTGHCADGVAYGGGNVFQNNIDGTITKLSFSGNNYTGTVTSTEIAIGGGYGDLASVGPDGAFYVTNYGAILPDGSIDSSALIRIALKSGDQGFGDGSVPTETVPEPGSLALLGLGLAGFLDRLRKKRGKRSGF